MSYCCGSTQRYIIMKMREMDETAIRIRSSMTSLKRHPTRTVLPMRSLLMLLMLPLVLPLVLPLLQASRSMFSPVDLWPAPLRSPTDDSYSASDCYAIASYLSMCRLMCRLMCRPSNVAHCCAQPAKYASPQQPSCPRCPDAAYSPV